VLVEKISVPTKNSILAQGGKIWPTFYLLLWGKPISYWCVGDIVSEQINGGTKHVNV
jgi:hypothetical protein